MMLTYQTRTMPRSLKDLMLSYLATLWRSRTPAWVYAVSLLPSCAILALVTIQPWVPLHQLVRDSMAVTGVCIRAAGTLEQAQQCTSVYFGLLSNLGILLWCASVAVCLFAFLQVYHVSRWNRPGAFLLYAGIFTGILLMDDFFQGHEKIYPKVFGTDEEMIYAVYAALLAFYLVVFRDDLLKCDPKLLCLSLALFALSLLIDQLVEIEGLLEKDGIIHRLFEDGSKFVAVYAWAVFHIRAAWLTVERSGVRQSRAVPCGR